jgi:hypothetical protein
MDNDDKTYMWLIVSAFIALLIGFAFACMELADLKSENQGQPSSLFN